MATVTVAALTHDLIRKRSLVTMVWDDDPEKRVALPVPYAAISTASRPRPRRRCARCPPKPDRYRSRRRLDPYSAGLASGLAVAA